MPDEKEKDETLVAIGVRVPKWIYDLWDSNSTPKILRALLGAWYTNNIGLNNEGELIVKKKSL